MGGKEQAREPKGTPTGGRWAKGDGAHGDDSDLTPPAFGREYANADGSATYVTPYGSVTSSQHDAVTPSGRRVKIEDKAGDDVDQGPWESHVISCRDDGTGCMLELENNQPADQRTMERVDATMGLMNRAKRLMNERRDPTVDAPVTGLRLHVDQEGRKQLIASYGPAPAGPLLPFGRKASAWLDARDRERGGLLDPTQYGF